jgi:glycosyltransferase involved in cell wall biosynthesis
MNQNNSPIVSVLMTSFNREAFIEESMYSVLNSSFTDLELIVSDDCSSDNTIEIVKKIASLDSRVKWHINEKNLGDYPNRNKVAGIAKGKYMLYVDSDDTIKNDAIEFAITNLIGNPTAKFSVIYPFEDIQKPTLLNPNDSLRKHFYDRSFLNLGPGGVVFNREFFISNLYYTEHYGPANDLYSHLKFASKGNVLLLPYRYLNYRIHDGQESTNKYVYLYLNQLVIRDALKELELPFSTNEKKRILKNKSITNLFSIVRYILKYKKIKQGLVALKKAKFVLNDFI